MLISIDWLGRYVNLEGLSAFEIAEGLTVSGLEIEFVEKTGAKFSNIKTVKIVSIKEHPNAEKLHLVDIDTGNGIKTVVCGAQNIKEGQIVPYASVGSKVLNRKTGELFELTPAKIRGVVSEGMLCSCDELGLDDYKKEDGIFILNDLFETEPALGQPLEKLLNIYEDTVLNIAPTANRGDEMSVIGVAREVAAIFGRELKLPETVNFENLPETDFEVEIKDDDVCKYYSAGILSGIKIKPSPDYMKNRLEASGIRSINNVVDITNYVLLEYGQPLHAFDKDKIGNYLCVQRAKDGEKFITLDETERTLTNDSVMVSTKNEHACAGGVFGGLNSGIDDNSEKIVLEGAYFVPAAVRKSSRSIGYRSEASARFERGVDICNVKQALFRAMKLMEELADAKIEGFVETGSDKLGENKITLRFSQIKKVTGIEIPEDKVVEILTKLGFNLCERNSQIAVFEVPGFRANDVKAEIDLIEEVIRIYGYDKIPSKLPSKTLCPEISFEEKIISRVQNLFTGCGFYEAMTSSLTGEPLLEEFGMTYDKAKAVKVINPQSEEFTMLRQNLAASLISCMKNNYDNGTKDLRLFELGKTYFADKPATKENSGVSEILNIAGIMLGEVNSSLWKKLPQTDFYDLKGVISGLFELLGVQNRVKISPCSDISYMHPGRCAKVVLPGKTFEETGYFGQIHPALLDKLKINKPAFLFELNAQKLFSAVSKNIVKFKKLPLYPEIKRDIAFTVRKDVSCESLNNVIKKSVDPKLFKSSEIFDVYTGENIAPELKSVAFRIKIQSTETTLTDEITDTQMQNIIKGLEKAFPSVKIR